MSIRIRLLNSRARLLVSNYSAIGGTISCDAPCRAIGFRGELFCDTTSPRPVFPDTPRIARSPIVRSGEALPPSSVTATLLGLFRTFALEGTS